MTKKNVGDPRGTALVSAMSARHIRERTLSGALATMFDKVGLGDVQLPLGSGLYGAAFSQDTLTMERRVSDLQIPPSPAALISASGKRPLQERLFDATAGVKILTSQIAMHLEREWREKLFRQLDSLHDPAEWEPDDEPVRQASFATFLKAIVQIKPNRRPGLGLSHTGNLIAAWTEQSDRLTVEFLPNDGVRWVIGRNRDDGPEHIAGQTRVARLSEALSPYHPEIWFS